MGFGRGLPYRGDGNPKNTKPKQRFVNRKQLQRETIKSILIVILFWSALLSCIIFSVLQQENSTSAIAYLVFGSILALVLALGIRSFNRFRKGYDVDLSNDSNKDDEVEPKNKKD